MMEYVSVSTHPTTPVQFKFVENYAFLFGLHEMPHVDQILLQQIIDRNYALSLSSLEPLETVFKRSIKDLNAVKENFKNKKYYMKSINAIKKISNHCRTRS